VELIKLGYIDVCVCVCVVCVCVTYGTIHVDRFTYGY